MIIPYSLIEEQQIKDRLVQSILNLGLDSESKALQELWAEVYQQSGDNAAIAHSKFMDKAKWISKYLMEILTSEED